MLTQKKIAEIKTLAYDACNTLSERWYPAANCREQTVKRLTRDIKSQDPSRRFRGVIDIANLGNVNPIAIIPIAIIPEVKNEQVNQEGANEMAARFIGFCYAWLREKQD
jgi:hypothetical protein